MQHGTRSEYKTGAAGSNSCPSRYTTITTASACVAAALALNLGGMATPQELRSDYPKGCYQLSTTGFVQFNKHASGSTHTDSTPICKVESHICDWVEFPGRTESFPRVRHTSKLGFANADLIAYQKGQANPESAEYAEFKTVVKRTLGLDYPQAFTAVLTKCSQEGADSNCDVSVAKSDGMEFTDKFGDDHMCKTATPGRDRSGTLLLLEGGDGTPTMARRDSATTSGYGRAPGAVLGACRSLWSTVTGGVSLQHTQTPAPYQSWHKMRWAEMSESTRTQWLAVGSVGGNKLETALTNIHTIRRRQRLGQIQPPRVHTRIKPVERPIGRSKSSAGETRVCGNNVGKAVGPAGAHLPQQNRRS